MSEPAGLIEPSPTGRSSLSIALQLALGPMIALGLARFAYAIVLPAMRETLGMSFAQAGLLNTANAAGYLLGSLCTPWLARKLGLKRAFDVHSLATALIVFAVGLWPDFGWLLGSRFLGGFGGAVVFVTGGALVAELAAERKQPPTLLISTYFSGVGLGLLLSALIAPPVLGMVWVQPLQLRWQLAWLLMGGCGILLYAVGRARWKPQRVAMAAGSERPILRPLTLMLLAYLLFGAGYITYMTFVIAYIQSSLPQMEWTMLAWGLLGVSIIFAPRLWQRVLDRAPRATALSAVMAVLIAAVLTVLLSTHIANVLISTALFGAFLIIPSVITIIIRRSLPARQWTAALSVTTAAFAVGQMLGPLLSGWLADFTGSLVAGLWLSVALLTTGAGLAWLQRDVPTPP